MSNVGSGSKVKEPWSDRLITFGIWAFVAALFACCCGFCALGGLFQDDPQAQEELPVLFWIFMTVCALVLFGACCLGWLILFSPYVEFWGKRLRGEVRFRFVHLIADVLALSFAAPMLIVGYFLIRQFV